MSGEVPSRLTISRIGSQGDGIAETSSGLLHVPHALPGESYHIVGDGSPVLDGPRSPDRRSRPLCPHFPSCGGCGVQHMSGELYQRWKSELLSAALAQHGLASGQAAMLTVGEATRRRATFTGRFQHGKMRLGFHAARSHVIEPIQACVVLVPAIVRALPALTDLAARLCSAAGEVRLGVLAADNGLDVSVSTEPRRKPRRADPGLAAAANAAGVVRLAIDGAPAFQVAQPLVTMDGVPVTPPPGAFLQAARATEAIFADLVAHALGKAKCVADLFAGLGTITLPMARRARVVAIDSDRQLLDALAKAVRHASGLKPVETLVRDLFRDPLSPRELDRFDAVVVDPPRAGAKAQSEALAGSKVATVVMVSCNPATLARDLRTLVDGGYKLEAATSVDQFLYTAHLEAVAVLRRA
ncbi:MAG: RsmD family RNA methyltransferase [Hyphomicrobiaceae bacterium]|nr:RsmD family RNA methyltransferase [Hyphomicrobiaceae bacterium]